MANIWGTDGGLFCGYQAEATEGKPPPFHTPLYYTGDRHFLLIGPNGSGKTKRVIVPALADLVGYSFLVNDIKGELCQMTAAHREAAGNLIIRLNPFNVLGLGSDGFNPIAVLNHKSDEFPDDALELAEAVIRIEGREPHFAQAAQELIAALIMYVRLILPENGSFADVRKLLSRDDNGWVNLVKGGKNTDERQLELWEKTPKEDRDPDYHPPFRYNGILYPGMIQAGEFYDWPEIGNKVARFGGITPQDREMHSVISTALVQTRWLDSVSVQVDLAKNPIDFSVAKERPVTVYLILPARRLGTHAPWLRLMVAGFIQKLMKDTIPGKVPIMLMLDEYAALAGGSGYGKDDSGDGFPVVARNMPMFRGYGIKLFTAWQDLAQAERIYGDGFQSFLANAGVVMSFAPQDIVTAEYLSDLTGQTTRHTVSSSQSRNQSPSSAMGVNVTDSVNVNAIAMAVMLPQQIRNLDPGFVLIFSHVAKGPVRAYIPWPGDVDRLKEIMKLDPARDVAASPFVLSSASAAPPSRTSFWLWLRRWLRL